MTKIIKSKYRTDRRYKTNIWGETKSSLEKRKSIPGQHGNRRSKLSNYAIQLAERQKLRKHYGRITEGQFRRTYVKASKMKGDRGNNLISLLETRMDSIVYRCKFASTIFSARQMVSHKYFLLNGKQVNIPSHILKVGDVISLKEKNKNLTIITQALTNKERETPSYVEVDTNTMTAVLINKPTLESVPYGYKVEPNLVIEWYSSRA